MRDIFSELEMRFFLSSALPYIETVKDGMLFLSISWHHISKAGRENVIAQILSYVQNKEEIANLHEQLRQQFRFHSERRQIEQAFHNELNRMKLAGNSESPGHSKAPRTEIKQGLDFKPSEFSAPPQEEKNNLVPERWGPDFTLSELSTPKPKTAVEPEIRGPDFTLSKLATPNPKTAVEPEIRGPDFTLSELATPKRQEAGEKDTKTLTPEQKIVDQFLKRRFYDLLIENGDKMIADPKEREAWRASLRCPFAFDNK